MKFLIQNVFVKSGKEPGIAYESFVNQIAFGSAITVESDSPVLEFSIRRLNQADNSSQDHIVEFDFSGLKKKDRDFKTLSFECDSSRLRYEKRILVEVV